VKNSQNFKDIWIGMEFFSPCHLDEEKNIVKLIKNLLVMRGRKPETREKFKGNKKLFL
jgi:hypothetical protein